jgi:hypothetical protein
MRHIVEVDQSGKVEDTKEDTVLAFANGITRTVLIPATVKRDCVTLFRLMGQKGKVFYLQLYAIALFFLLKEHGTQLSNIIIDEEYYGREGDIKRYLLNLFTRAGTAVTARQIHFGYVGKASTAHDVAVKTLRGKRRPDKTLTFAEIMSEFQPQKNRGLPRGRKP